MLCEVKQPTEVERLRVCCADLIVISTAESLECMEERGAADETPMQQSMSLLAAARHQ
jgi:hypothetical protein